MPLKPSILGGYQTPAGDLAGVRTVVTQPNPTEPGETSRGVYKERGLPSPPWKHEKPMGTPSYNGPGASPSAPEKNLHEDKARTKGLPGEESPAPASPPRQSPKRRTNMGSMTGPGSRIPKYRDRQRKQRGRAKRYYKRYYQKNRSVIKRRMERWYRRNRERFNYQKDQFRRRRNPNKFKRLPGGVEKPLQRSKDWREKKAAAVLIPPAAFLYLPTDESGLLWSLDPDTGLAHVTIAAIPGEIPFEELFDEILMRDEADVGRVMDWLDEAFEWEAEGEDEEVDEEDEADEAFEGWLGGRGFRREAEMFYEKRPVEGEPSNHYDRAKTPYWREIEKSDEPASDLPSGTVWNNPGSAKVIPEGHDFENKGDKTDRYKQAAVISDIELGCDPAIRRKAVGIPVKMVRSDEKNLVWLFDVEGEKDVYRVRAKAIPRGNVSDINKVDLLLSCTCPFWRWQGPEHWAKNYGYLYGKPRGTAAAPTVKDPASNHAACKHVLACLKKMTGFILPSRGKKAASVEVRHFWIDGMASSVARRYVGRVAKRRSPC